MSNRVARSAILSRSSILLRLLSTPWRILGLVLLVVFAVEALVMLLLPLILPQGISDTLEAFIDAALLTAISAPAIWWIIIAPLRRMALEAQALSSTIVDSAGDGILTTDADGLVLSYNPAAKELFGHDTAAVLGQPISRLLPDSDLTATAAGQVIGTSGRRRSGATFPASVSVRRLEYEEGTANVIVVRDLTEARRAEEERTTAARQQEALRAQQMATLAQLATGVAHEIRNPLTAIKMLVQSTHSNGEDTPLSAEDLQIVEDQIRRMEQSINALLDFARPPGTERRPVSLQTVLKHAVRLLEGQARKQHVTLQIDSHSPNLTLNADPDQLQQLLVNLSLNALNVLPAGGTVTFSIASHAPDTACILVADSGPGIPADAIDNIFDPFFTTRKQGIGLGLNICKRIAEEHGGTITARNSSSGGAVFELCIPCTDSTAADSSDAHHAVPGS
jgi:PAS domain S-box-containing protein